MSVKRPKTKFDPAYMFNDWDSLGLHPCILDAIHELGFERPTEIQRRVIPPAIGSRHANIIGAAETVSFFHYSFYVQVLLGIWENISFWPSNCTDDI